MFYFECSLKKFLVDLTCNIFVAQSNDHAISWLLRKSEETLSITFDACILLPIRFISSIYTMQKISLDDNVALFLQILNHIMQEKVT